MDTKNSTGVWLLPSRRRIPNLRRFFDAARSSNTSTPGWVLVLEDEYVELKADYDTLVLPPGWKIMPIPGCDLQGDKVRAVWPLVKDMDWVGLIGDDNIPMSPDWDSGLVGSLQGWNFVSCNDGWQAPERVANCWVVSGDLMRAVGYFWPTKLNHLYIDDMWETIGRETKCWSWRLDIMVKHNHATLQKTEDETHGIAYSDKNWAHDSQVWQDWVLDEKDDVITRVEKMKSDIGLVSAAVDMTGVSVMIATPCGSGKFCSEYVGSLFNTFSLLRDQNVAFKWVIECGNADLVAARAELFAAFLESGYSHLIMIDDDMGWESNAVLRLLWSKKDFVAVAGRKKRDHPIYALNVLETDKSIIEIPVDSQSGTAEVKEVGMAFCLFTRACVEKMVAGFPDLRYVLPDGAQRWSLCLPLFTDKGAYKAEDYAFCHRWRQLGEQVFVCPDVSIKHVGGMKVFEGSWADTWTVERKPQIEEAAE